VRAGPGGTASGSAKGCALQGRGQRRSLCRGWAEECRAGTCGTCQQLGDTCPHRFVIFASLRRAWFGRVDPEGIRQRRGAPAPSPWPAPAAGTTARPPAGWPRTWRATVSPPPGNCPACPAEAQYCRATPTECLPFFGMPVSSTIQATTGRLRVMAGSTCRTTAASTASSLHGAALTRCWSDCRAAWTRSRWSRAAMGSIDLRCPGSSRPRQ
jgi:hypothetical protein